MFRVDSQLTEQIRRFRGVGKRAARDIAADALRRVGISDPERVLRAYPHELSGGMAQRVTIALALTGGPKLLIADEPTTALDVTVQAEILDLLRTLVVRDGIAIILVSHDVGVIADVCDRVAVMYAGEVVEHGTVADVLESPQHPYTSALLTANPHVSGGQPIPVRLPMITGSVPVPGAWPQGCRFAPRCPWASAECERRVDLETIAPNRSVRCVKAPITELLDVSPLTLLEPQLSHRAAEVKDGS
jgi:peptide/nickel transport system permease protein